MVFVTACESISPTQVQVALAVSIQTGLPLAVKDKARLTQIANYADVYAHGLRTITGTPTAEELSAQLEKFIPASVVAKYPELKNYILPLIVDEYKRAYAHNKNSVAQTYAYINTIATAVENGVAPYVTK